ncbi:cullin protein, putative [Theileria equi strain WA]|uniref:Cullin protein, putative n=1 Tax=Theileria equi strain WA TaxID=1537102 RepID=L0B240_THEEQ|nr:cullin protein, putative [Theileria equi strain WA]AFZ81311.1 cullin protein, putative [Theileria equi strain WA]|eukprot:XP_004830977.1 cullin protein, putative [Theileria equi strain WA]
MLEPSGVPFDKSWNRIRSEFMEKIEDELDYLDNFHDKKPLKIRPDDYIKYYTLVYNMCVQKDSNYAELLYNRLGETLSEYIKTKMCIRLKATKSDESELKQILLTNWRKYKHYIHILTGIFAYLDRFYVPLAVQPTIYEYGMAIFQRLIFEPYKDFLKSVVLNALDSKRSGGVDNPSLDADITNIVEMFNKLDSTSGTQYKMELEPFILDRANGYYLKIAPLWISELSLGDYLHIVQHCMEEEKMYCEKYFNESTKEQLLATIISSLLFNQRIQLFNKFTQLFSLFMDNEVKELKRIYKPLSKLEGAHQSISEQLKRAIEESLTGIDSENKIQNIVKVFSKFKRLFVLIFM